MTVGRKLITLPIPAKTPSVIKARSAAEAPADSSSASICPASRVSMRPASPDKAPPTTEKLR